MTLGDLQRFFETFLAMHRRQIQRKGSFFEFLVPDVLKPTGLPERYHTVTFDRELAIRRTDAEFMAIGHPFIDAMLAYVGSYDFGGLTAIREINAPEIAGIEGFLFIFVIRRRIARGDGDEYLFELAPVFSTAEGKVDETALGFAMGYTTNPGASSVDPPDPDIAFKAAKKYLEQKAGIWDWDEDVEFIGLSWVVFK